MNLSIVDFLKLRNELPVVDVRSENEYQEGHIMNAVNIPILNNDERVAVGTDYKQKGQLAAIKTGFKLVGPRIHDLVLDAEKVSTGKELLVHCWRGGMRSSNFCQFIGMANIKSHQLQGGYKAYRAEAIRSFSSGFKFLVLAGYTGSGKSEVLRALKEAGEQVIDLELLANHKGSAFGGLMMSPQPTTEQFQNNLFELILQLDLNRRIWVEDESITIGKIVLPDSFWRTMNASPVVQLDVDKNIRVERLVREYGNANREEFLKAMSAITKKLGGQHFQSAKEKLLRDDLPGAIDILLTYYDKAYLLGLKRKEDRVKSIINWDGRQSSQVAHHLLTSVS